MMAGGFDQSPCPRGGALAGDTATCTSKWSDRMISVTEAAMTFESKLSLTSHLSILAEDALLAPEGILQAHRLPEGQQA